MDTNYVAEDYKDHGKGCNRGTGEGEKSRREVLIVTINISLIDSLVSFFSSAFQFLGDRAMRARMMPSSRVIEQERRRWMRFRRALAKEDQGAFDRMFVCAMQQLQAEVQLRRPWRFEAVLMAVLVAHEKRVVELARRIKELKASSRP
jgi:hypothetical protein